MHLRPWRLGILGQALVPLAIGSGIVVAGAAFWHWWAGAVQARERALHQLAARAEMRALREQPRFDQVAAQIELCCRLLARAGAADLVPLDADGAASRIAPPLAVFVAASAAGDAAQRAAAGRAVALLRELAPLLGDAELTIAVPGRWLAGHGAETCALVEAMLPADPVLLPGELEVVGEPGPVRWSRAHVEPASGRWRIAATATLDLPGVGRAAITRILPVDEVLARAARDQQAGGTTAVFDAGGHLLASAGAAAASLPGIVAAHGSAHELLPLPDDSGWIGISRLAGPGWVMASVHPVAAVEAQARRAIRPALLLAGALLLAQGVLLVLVLRRRVGAPLRALSVAATRLAAGERADPAGLVGGRNDELGDLSRAFATMSDAIAAREAQLREREQFARAIVDSVADGVLVLRGDRIVEANQRAVEVFGRAAAELIGRTPADLSPPSQNDGEGSVAAQERLLAQALSSPAPLHFRWLHTLPDGALFEAEVGLARVGDGATRLTVAVVRDLTERNRLEEQLRHGQKMESIGQLAGGVAHDFNNMLAGIMGSAELLRRSDDAERRTRHIATIISACERAAGLTRKLLTFARKGRGMSTAIDVHQLVRDTVLMLESGLDKRIAVSAELDAAAATVVGDSAQLQNALLNLGLNARDAMPDGGRLTYRSALRSSDEVALLPGLLLPVEPGDYLEIAVADTGCGIPAALLPRIFEPFFTTKPVGKGTGLGLAAVWGTVQDHHGSLAVVSAPGAGTVFTLLLPLSDQVAPAGVFHQPETRPGRGTVLLIDDEPLVRASGRELLEALGWQVIEAGDGHAGVEVFGRERGRIAVVLVDMEMPRLRGVECLRELRRIDPGVRAVLCSGFARDVGAGELRGEGFRGQLAKPYRLSELDRVLEAALG